MDPTVEDLHSNPKKKGQCLKITEKVATELGLRFKKVKNGEKCQNSKIQVRHFE